MNLGTYHVYVQKSPLNVYDDVYCIKQGLNFDLHLHLHPCYAVILLSAHLLRIILSLGCKVFISASPRMQ